jgi:simple sugar transport system permease protein
MNDELINILSSIIANATPLVIAGLGETITERSGVVNLSLDGSLALSALAGFAAALVSGSILAGCVAAMLVGALIALLIAFGSIELRQDQVAIGFVLTLLCADLAQFLGQGVSGQRAIVMPQVNIPILSEIPVLGPVFFQQTAIVYVSYVLIFGLWFWMFHTRHGLALRAVGDRPETAFARGTPVNRLRYFYTIVGGAVVGLGGAAFSLAIKPGWSNPPAMRGEGWIALAIVIFGGWHPFRVVFGAYLFAVLRALSSAIQRSPDIEIPLVLLNLLPWALMILTLMLVSGGVIDRLLRVMPRPVQKWMRNFLSSDPPSALGTRFDP